MPRYDDNRNQQLIDDLTNDAKREVRRDGVIHCNTAIALADAGVDPDTLQDQLQAQYL